MATHNDNTFDPHTSPQESATRPQAEAWGAAQGGSRNGSDASALPDPLPHLASAGNPGMTSAPERTDGARAPQTAPTAADSVLTAPEWHTLCALRARYREGRDLFSAGELAHLRFVRWLYQTSRLVR